MRTRIFVVDAFSDWPFGGNSAGVCLLDSDRGDDWMQSVASEMLHPETAFLVPDGEAYGLRWFTPTLEVDLCGHATLAAAHVLWELGWVKPDAELAFQTRSGTLSASRDGDRIALDFPSEPPQPEEPDAAALKAIGQRPLWFGRNRMDWIALLESERAVREFKPDFDAIQALGMRGLIITAKGDGDHDFVSRFFAPSAGVNEDPVTGSAHCCLAPFWSERLGKSELDGYQASRRGGSVRVRALGPRVELIGNAVTVLAGELRC